MTKPLSEYRWQFYMNVARARQIFEQYGEQLAELSLEFWKAFRHLERDANDADWVDLKITAKQAFRELGSAGPFGYGHPCGKSLQAMYDSWNALCEAQMKVDEQVAVGV